ncbi:MAG: hypothetical protein IJZ68_11570 [Bacteroidaceae bacterium]|nr:hypothetical protein [Bacteroidaceae bacterium]
MKLNKSLAILACGALVFASCQDEDVADNKFAPAQPGDEILFGGAMSFGDGNNAKTRTVYGDKGATGTEIKWYEDDQVRIYCAQATLGEGETDQKYCDYTVTNYIEKPVYNGATLTNPTESNPKGDGNYDKVHESALETVDGNPGLRWGEGEHTFYGVYPAPGQLSGAGDNVGANALSLNGNTLTGYLPNTQAPVRYVAPTSFATKNVDGSDLTADHYTIHPAMRNAYMVAKATAKPADGGVTLTFLPVVTAVEITLQNNTTYTNAQNQTVGVALEGVSLINLTSSNVICGSFKIEIGGTYETNVNTNQTTDDDSYKTVGVPIKGTDGNPITLKYGDKITFTAFMLLNTDLSQISVSVVTEGMTKVATLSGKNDVKIVQAKKKNFIADVPISWSTVETISLENWISSIPNNSTETDANGNPIPNYLSGLSIPGAGGATSYAFDATYITDNSIGDELVAASQEQTLNIDQLWNRGIRCFEFMVDNASNFGGQYVYCNGIKTTTTLKDAVDAVAAKIANTKDANGNLTEFGMVIITYQEENYTLYDRNAGRNGFADYFGTWWKSYSYTGVTKKLFNSNLTIADARGCLFCIGRPVAAGLDAGWYTGVYDDAGYSSNWLGQVTTTPCTFSDGTVLNVLGWGNNADQWYARGFGTLKTVAATSVESKTITTGVNDRPFYVSDASYITPTGYTPKTSNFSYKVSNQGHVVWGSMDDVGWIQEWRRVVPTEATRTQYSISAIPSSTPTQGGGDNSYYYSWEPSEDEKWDDIVEALDKAIKKDGGYSLYLNSLCGYFVDGDIEMSYLPRPTFQRFIQRADWLGTYHSVYLDDKYRDLSSLDGGTTGDDDTPNISNFGPYHPAGGFRGNIAAYADWVNNKFYNLLLTMQANGELNGPTGIVMMDRVSATADNPAGYYIPQIIIANNFREASASNINVTYSTYAQDDTPAAPVRK